MGFYSLLTGTLHKKTKTKKLPNFPNKYGSGFYRNLNDSI